MLTTLTIKLNHSSYPIYIGQKLLHNTDLLAKHILGKQILIVSEQHIAENFLPQIASHLKNYQVDSILLSGGEYNKTLANAENIFTALIKNYHHRNSTIVAYGGGVIGDMAGFAAACYQRGINYIQIPTTLLAQVDASIGGKTAVNHTLGKNMIGAFHQPQCVIIDIETLYTLEPRQFNSGLAEIIKAALICDKDFFSWLEQHILELVAKNPEMLVECITRACTIKNNIVRQDEKEILGIRALLNLGHTFGHALEQVTDYKVYLHGEAVAIGLVMAAEVSARLLKLPTTDVERIKKLLQTAQLPIRPIAPLNIQELGAAMLRDKKNDSNNLNLVLLDDIGAAKLTPNMDIIEVMDILNYTL